MGNERRATEAFKKLQKAHEVLGDEYKRKLYDAELKREERLSHHMYRSYECFNGNDFVPTADSSSGVTHEEVERLLNCADHYSALGFSKFDEIKDSILKANYREKAILVHPDKNMGNERRATEAFKNFKKLMRYWAMSALTGMMACLTITIILVALIVTVLLWMYDNFWTTACVAFYGGLAFALLIATLYLVYCGWFDVGWLGLLYYCNALMFYLTNNNYEFRSPDTPSESNGPGNLGEQRNAASSESDFVPTADSSSGVTHEEVERLLNCADHYSALGFSKFVEIKDFILKANYRRKAILVHPDKNMGNERRATEAFKKLQKAHEVLGDEYKRKLYDAELKRNSG
ncbi:hypothetical protein POM88_027094 [Heracleum sosnowskyi]|uniref:J domain-containing protein n=1 Tax=Heracleum sosnowskyi TaxID=360622 RepID=A0AAD8IAB5_9APIA|nr:hypothetical protein POM88_027094 [Heracleum sosnowskyi]